MVDSVPEEEEESLAEMTAVSSLEEVGVWCVIDEPGLNQGMGGGLFRTVGVL